MISKIKAFWASIPHPVQALIIAFATAAGAAFAQSLETGSCFTAACIRHYAWTALLAGAAAARAFYMVPNRPALPEPTAIDSKKQ